MTSASIQHYQACFRISASGEDDFSKLQSIIFEWILKKERDEQFKKAFPEFKHIYSLSSFSRTKSTLATNTCFEDGGKSWAMRYEEKDKEHGPLRFWYTDVGIRLINNEIVFYTRVSYAWNQSDLSDFEEAPSASVPRFVNEIIGGEFKVYRASPQFRLTNFPAEITEKTAEIFTKWISAPERPCPILVFNGDGLQMKAEAKKLAETLSGKCQVFIIPKNQYLAEAIKALLPRELDIKFNSFRVFFPFGVNGAKPSRHRWYHPDAEEYKDQRQGIISGLLRKYTAIDKDAIESIADVHRRISHVKLEKFKKENSKTGKELDEFYKMLEDAEKDRDYQKQCADLLAAEVDELEQKISELKYQLGTASMRAKQIDNTRVKVDFIDSFSSIPENLPDVVKAYGHLYCDRLAFAESALSSAEKYDEFKSIAEAWEMLYDISNHLYEIKFNTPAGKSVDLEKAFSTIARYELSMTETKATKKDKGLMAQRKIQHEGEEYDISPHVKWGSFEPKMLRIHFAFDEVLKRIVVGYIGPHMDTAGTKRM